MSVDGSGNLDYTPNSNFSGTDSIFFTITNGAATATSTVEIVAQAGANGDPTAALNGLSNTIDGQLTNQQTGIPGWSSQITATLAQLATYRQNNNYSAYSLTLGQLQNQVGIAAAGANGSGLLGVAYSITANGHSAALQSQGEAFRLAGVVSDMTRLRMKIQTVYSEIESEAFQMAASFTPSQRPMLAASFGTTFGRLNSAMTNAADVLDGVDLTAPAGNNTIARLNDQADTITNDRLAMEDSISQFADDNADTMAAAGEVMATTNDEDDFLAAQAAFKLCVENLSTLIGAPGAGGEAASGLFAQIKDAMDNGATPAKATVAPDGGVTDQFALKGIKALLRFPLTDLAPSDSIDADLVMVQNATLYYSGLVQYVSGLGWGAAYDNTVATDLGAILASLNNARYELRGI